MHVALTNLKRVSEACLSASPRLLGDWRISRLGITARLSIAFAAVAVLAVAANVVTEHGPALIGQNGQLSAAPILETLGEFERLAARRAEVSRLENADQLTAAGRRLQRETASFTERAGALADARAHTLPIRVQVLREQTGAMVREADTRRRLVQRYWRHFEAVDAQMKGALDRTWKLFGRVITRESLLTLSRDLDDIRRRSASLTSSGGHDQRWLDGLAQSQIQFAATLEQNARSLERSQGVEWLAAQRNDLSAIVAIRTELALVDERATRARQDFERSSGDLATLARSVEQRLRSAPHSSGVERAQPDGAAAEVAGPNPTQHTALTSSAPRDGLARASIAAISAAVMLLLVAISYATVRAVVGPVREFMATTKRVAAGDARARFARGGMRELDELAVSLNEMAEQLASAQALTQEHQAQLEVRVDERTRQLVHLAEHDPLTGLPNRRQLLSYLRISLKNAADHGMQVAVFFIDLDNFKNINDSLGHAFGDLVLQGVAQRLREATAASGFAARLGGDEFTVIYERAAGLSEITGAGAELVQAFQKPLLIEGRELLISISIGASVYPDHEVGADALLRAADAALFNAKSLGRSRVCLFSPELLEAASSRFRIEQGLRHAVDRGELELLFQPEVNFDALGTTLVEALLRWRLPDGRHVPPNEFLAVAEESGLIMDISDWVLRTAIQFAATCHHGAWPEVRVAINVSARQLLDARFVDRVCALLSQYNLPPRCVEIELTENVLQTGPATIETLRRLRQLDIAVALDDFGTGYSSLASLEQLPLTRVKLDRSLIASIDTSVRSLAIARAIIGLCRSLGLEVTAEGVERPAQLALLLAHHSICLQGFLIARPIPQDAVHEVVAQMPERLQSLLLALPRTTNAGAYAMAAPELGAERRDTDHSNRKTARTS